MLNSWRLTTILYYMYIQHSKMSMFHSIPRLHRDYNLRIGEDIDTRTSTEIIIPTYKIGRHQDAP